LTRQEPHDHATTLVNVTRYRYLICATSIDPWITFIIEHTVTHPLEKRLNKLVPDSSEAGQLQGRTCSPLSLRAMRRTLHSIMKTTLFWQRLKELTEKFDKQRRHNVLEHRPGNHEEVTSRLYSLQLLLPGSPWGSSDHYDCFDCSPSVVFLRAQTSCMIGP
jgi:hypothetical protein